METFKNNQFICYLNVWPMAPLAWKPDFFSITPSILYLWLSFWFIWGPRLCSYRAVWFWCFDSFWIWDWGRFGRISYGAICLPWLVLKSRTTLSWHSLRLLRSALSLGRCWQVRAACCSFEHGLVGDALYLCDHRVESHVQWSSLLPPKIRWLERLMT